MAVVGDDELVRDLVPHRIASAAPPEHPDSDLPDALAQHRHAVAGGGDAGDVDLGGADHEVDVHLAAVDPFAVALLYGPVEALAEGDVAGRVLVEQRVVEDRVERADPPARVDEGELAEAAGALVALRIRLEHVAVLFGVDRGHPAALEAHLEAAHDRAGELARLGRADDAVDPLRVGRREDFLGREVGPVRKAPRRRHAPAHPVRAGQEPDAQIRAGPLQVDDVEATRVQRLACPLQLVDPFRPGGHRIVGVEAADDRDLLPQPVERRLRLEVGVHERRPALGRAGHDRPVVASLGHVLVLLLRRRRPVAADPVGVDAVEQPRRDRPAERDRRSLLGAVLTHALHEPLRLVAEGVVGRILQSRALDVGVAVDHVKVRRARLVHELRDLAGERLLARRGDQDHLLPRLDVGSEPHGELRQPVQRGGIHGRILSTAAILPSQMRNHTLARGLALAGVAAASATAAHGGAAALADPAWSIPALAAASAGAIALLHMASSAGRARHAAARARHGTPLLAAHTTLGLPETAAVMLAAQGCANVALLAAGAPAHTGQAGALALHTALALLGAGLVWSADRALALALEDLDAAVIAAIELLLRLATPPPPAPVPAPSGRLAIGAHRGRAPPPPA